MKTLRIVRSEGSKQIARFFIISPKCLASQFYLVLSQVFSASYLNYKPQLSNSQGRKLNFPQLQDKQTYFLQLLPLDTPVYTQTPIIFTRPSRSKISPQIQVYLPQQYIQHQISQTRSKVQQTLSLLIRRLSDNSNILHKTILDTQNFIGSQSIRLLQYGKSCQSMLQESTELTPKISQLAKDLKKQSRALQTAYNNIPQPVALPKKSLPFFQSKRMNLKDLPVNQLSPNEFKRFQKYQNLFNEEEEVFFSRQPSVAEIPRQLTKVMILKDWSMALGYVRIEDEKIHITRTPSFKSYDEYFLKNLKDIKPVEGEEMGLKLNFKDGREFSLEFEELADFSYWKKLLANL